MTDDDSNSLKPHLFFWGMVFFIVLLMIGVGVWRAAYALEEIAIEMHTK